MLQITSNLYYLDGYGDENDEIEAEEVGESGEYGDKDNGDEELDYDEEEF